MEQEEEDEEEEEEEEEREFKGHERKPKQEIPRRCMLSGSMKALE